jgi:hypothetical protein
VRLIIRAGRHSRLKETVETSMANSSARFVATQIPNEEQCPVPNELIGRLYRAAESSVREIAATLLPAQQAELAMFCYGRAHLREIGLTIAASCDRDTLIAAAHSTAAGEVIYSQSRETGRASEGPARGRRAITLASKTSNSALAKLIAAMADDDAEANDNFGGDLPAEA